MDELRTFCTLLCVFTSVDMVGEPDRGAVLELLLAKVMHAGKGKIQVIGTMPSRLCTEINQQTQACRRRRATVSTSWAGG